MQGIKQVLRQLQDRLNKVETASGQSGLEGAEKLPSSIKNEEENKEENASNKARSINDILDTPHSSISDKVLEDLKYDIASIKEKLPNVQFMEGEIENMKKQFAIMKNELMNVGNKSNKSIKRESISNGVGSLANLRRTSVQKPRISGVKN